jgi:hypothetical protein
MRTTLMGGETEYAVALIPAGSAPPLPLPLLEAIMVYARRTLPVSTLSPNGRFLANGGLFYLDSGLHLEWSTPECTSPYDIVRYLRAGDRIVTGLVDGFVREQGTGYEGFCSRCNVDYEGGTAWASHESYLYRCDPDLLPRQLVPFLVSRIVICGAGGWEPKSPRLSFTLSPRARFTTQVTSGDTQVNRAIFNTKNETLSATGTHRLHVICGESLCSELATWLRFGTTALVLAAIEAGERPGDAMALRSPLAALWRVAGDPTCRAMVRLENGHHVSALEIQRHYFASVLRHLGSLALPDWAPAVVDRWDAVLVQLESDPEGMSRGLDWAIKRAVYGRFLATHGVDWTDLSRWNAFVDASADLEPDTPLFGRALRDAGLTRKQYEDIRAIRRKALELDMRFGQIGAGGVFDALDGAGALSHRIVAAGDIDAAVHEPPQGTRATLRGAIVRRLSEQRVRYQAGWAGVTDLDHRRTLDLGDPFESRERWGPMTGTQAG